MLSPRTVYDIFQAPPRALYSLNIYTSIANSDLHYLMNAFSCFAVYSGYEAFVVVVHLVYSTDTSKNFVSICTNSDAQQHKN